MTSKELNLKLIEALPEIMNQYQSEVEWQEGDDTGSHVVFGDVLTPFLIENINCENLHMIKKILNFIESILLIDDEYSNEVITCSVFESIVMTDINMQSIELELGTKSKLIWDDLKYT